jgi:hypothetical protein
MTAKCNARRSHDGSRVPQLMRLSVGMLCAALCGTVHPCAIGAQGRSTSDPRTDSGRTQLHVRYDADRWSVVAVTERGDSLTLYLDTGGGTCFLSTGAARRLGLVPVWSRQISPVSKTDSVQVVTLPRLSAQGMIPLPATEPPIGDRFLVFPDTDFSKDGFLGRTWFSGRVWVFDYPARTLAIRTRGLDRSAGPVGRVALGFQTDSVGQRTTQFPRLRVAVSGDSLDLLFDTWATVFPTPTAIAQFGDGGPPARGASFITQDVFDRWRQRHPDWRVIDRAQVIGKDTVPMILVPQVMIGGLASGPVWFTIRPTRNFHLGMSRWMDQQIDGALGGSALKYFRVTVDYPNAVALFERPGR